MEGEQDNPSKYQIKLLNFPTQHSEEKNSSASSNNDFARLICVLKEIIEASPSIQRSAKLDRE